MINESISRRQFLRGMIGAAATGALGAAAIEQLAPPREQLAPPIAKVSNDGLMLTEKGMAEIEQIATTRGMNYQPDWSILDRARERACRSMQQFYDDAIFAEMLK